MTRRKLLFGGIPALGLLAVINLLYFWIAPNVPCKMVVYAFGVAVILVQTVTTTLLWHFCGSEKATASLVSGSSFGLGIIAACGVLLSLNAPVKTAVFFLTVFTVLYLVCLGYLVCMATESFWNRPENATAISHRARPTVREWIHTAVRSFSRRRPGETDAERHIRITRNAPEPPQPASALPPPLPGQR